MNADGSIIYYKTPKTTHFYKLMALGFFLVGSWLVLGGSETAIHSLQHIAGLIGFLCFGFCTWRVGRRMNRRHRVYAINHDGFALASPDGTWTLNVDWKEGQGVAIADFGYDNALTFAFRDPEAVKARMTEKQRKRAEDNEAVGIPTLTLPQSALDTPVEEIRNVSTRFFFGAG